jgi:hypothetical protein
VPVSPSTRRIVASTRPPVWRARNRHAASPLVLRARTIHVPSIDGTPAVGTGTSVARRARMRYGSPRARRYSPARRPSSPLKVRTPAYWSRRNTTCEPFRVALVEAIRRSPLKKAAPKWRRHR